MTHSMVQKQDNAHKSSERGQPDQKAKCTLVKRDIEDTRQVIADNSEL